MFWIICILQFTISLVGFEHSPGFESLKHKILRKLKFSIRISYLLPTFQEKLKEELSAKSIF